MRHRRYFHPGPLQKHITLRIEGWLLVKLHGLSMRYFPVMDGLQKTVPMTSAVIRPLHSALYGGTELGFWVLLGSIERKRGRFRLVEFRGFPSAHRKLGTWGTHRCE